MTKLVDSALYVDFDNIYSSITNIKGADYAEFFATNPSIWIDYLTTAGIESETSLLNRDKRIFRKKVVYFNPHAFYYYRDGLVKSGLRVVDCPILTGLKKTATDISLVVDVMKDIQSFDYQDYVIVSSDADFSPLLFHINEQCKNSVLLAVGPTSPSTRSIATTCLSVQEFYDNLFNKMKENENKAPTFNKPVVIHKPDTPKTFGNSLFEGVTVKIDETD